MSVLPYIKFYPSDWLSEESLRLVSVGARGLWIDLLCLMAKSERRGYLQVNGGVNPTLAQIGKLVGLSTHEIDPLLSELKQAGTCSVEPETGILFSRRLVKDTELYNQAVKSGSMGGNPRLKKRSGKTLNPPVNLRRQPSLAITSNYGNGVSSEDAELASRCYEAYPRKQGRKKAIEAIEKAFEEFPSHKSQMLETVRKYALAVSLWPESEKQFVPHPATWFNQARFEDDPQTWVKQKTNGAMPHAVRLGDNLR